LTRRYVDAVSATGARIYDTRKTTPGWRRLEKYAVRVGGGWNHRTGLYDAILIKDNHLAFGREGKWGTAHFSPAEAVAQARQWIKRRVPQLVCARMIVEIEVDSLEQLDEVLPAGPDIVLLDNMAPAQLREAVLRRNARAPEVELEASGGVNLQTVRQIAETGVERISVGALTHSPQALDFGLDWVSSAERS
jgi:nicotinate-nucleotide pyrophosphorylase (carboxylating)